MLLLALDKGYGGLLTICAIAWMFIQEMEQEGLLQALRFLTSTIIEASALAQLVLVLILALCLLLCFVVVVVAIIAHRPKKA